MQKLCVNAVLIDDREGGQHTGHLMAYAPCEDGAVDTSSGALARAIVFYDDCLGTVHARALWTNRTYVIKTGVVCALEAMVQLLNDKLND
jgi:hypothetical protein